MNSLTINGTLEAIDPLCITFEDVPMISGSLLGSAVKRRFADILSLMGEHPCELHSRYSGSIQTDESSCEVCRLFGNREIPCRLGFEDCICIDNAPFGLERRYCIGIDRATGAPRKNAGFNYEIVPKGTRFTFRLNVGELDERREKYLELIINILRGRLITEGDYLAIGSRTTCGFGRIALTDVEPQSSPSYELVCSASKNAAYEVLIDYTLSACGPILVSEPNNKTFLTSRDKGIEKYVIPGSTIKGVIRHWIGAKYPVSDAEALFGYLFRVGLSSRASFSDMFADMNTVTTGIRYSAMVGGVSQRAASGSISTHEAVVRGDFSGVIRLYAVTTAEIRMILDALDALNKGEIRVGGQISRGFGRMRISRFIMTAANGFDSDFSPIIAGRYSSLGEAASGFSRE